MKRARIVGITILQQLSAQINCKAYSIDPVNLESSSRGLYKLKIDDDVVLAVNEPARWLPPVKSIYSLA